MSEWLPRRDTELLAFSSNFASKLAAAPATYGFTAAEATTLTNAQTAFSTALATAINPATRTRTAVANKDLAKAQVIAIIRSYAKRIQANPAILVGQKTDLGLPIYTNTRTPVPPPSVAPLLTLVTSASQIQVIKISDPAAPDRRARPAGVSAAEVYTWVPPTSATLPPEDLEDWRFEGLANKAEFAVDYRQSDIGKSAYVVARWVNPRGEPGPVSVPLRAAVLGTMAA